MPTGSETTATLLSGTTFYLMKNKDIYRKVAGEIRRTFQTDRDIDFVSASKLPYLNATIEEGLRIYPPVPSTLPRRTTSRGDVIDGQFVPGGTSIGVNQWAANQSTRNWRDPGKFIPERWLDDQRYAGDEREARQPFSIGPRNCIGRKSVLTSFSMKLCWRS